MNKTAGALIASLALLAAAPAAATPLPEPDKQPLTRFTVTKTDPTGDHYRIADGPKKAVKASIDLTRVTYRIVRDTDNPHITITYRVRDVTPGRLRVIDTAPRFEQSYFTVISAADGEEVSIASTGPAGDVTVTSSVGNVCDAASASLDTDANKVTHTVPLDCLAVDSGRLRSVTILERTGRAGALAADRTADTKRLPLSPALPDPDTQ